MSVCSSSGVGASTGSLYLPLTGDWHINCPYSTSELQLSIPAVCFGFLVIDSGYLSAMLTTTLFWGGDSKRQRCCNAGLSASDM